MSCSDISLAVVISVLGTLLCTIEFSSTIYSTLILVTDALLHFHVVLKIKYAKL
jgi:hypothetical protein